MKNKIFDGFGKEIKTPVKRQAPQAIFQETATKKKFGIF